MSDSSNRLHVMLIDENRLRRAGIASLISSWAQEHEFEIRQIRAADVLKEFERSLMCRLVLYSVGGGSIRAVEASGVVRILNALAPHAKVIVISDREDPEEIVSAYWMSCRGFIPTNMEPALALQAISFILDGGTYFPPSALRPVTVSGSSGADNGGDAENDRVPNCGSGGIPVAHNGCVSAPTPAEPVNKAAVTVPHEEPEHLSSLTGRQYQVLQCLQKGQPNKLIARELGMTEGTVKVHVRQIMRRLGATNRTQVAILATRKSGGAARVPDGRVGRSDASGLGELDPGWTGHPCNALRRSPAAGADTKTSACADRQSMPLPLVPMSAEWKSHVNGH